ncbi:MAG: agmatine deiminase family protein [Thiovulaceae bacterium]|nr:agmatine deiminase family protein [Sulfurimonadaceae bacterium]
MNSGLIAEWEKQRAVILAFPHEESDWNNYLEEARKCVVEIVSTIARYEWVFLLCKDERETAKYFKNLQNIRLIEIFYNDTWMRDCSVLSVRNEKETYALDFTFNGWGEKHEARLDNAISTTLFVNNYLGTQFKAVDFVLEGGAVESDGNGTLLTTTSCMINPNRNGKKTKGWVGTMLRNELHMEKVLWLDHGRLEGDDTDGHIDTIARFCDESTIAYIGTPDPSDCHYESMVAMKKQLEGFTSAKGKPYQLVELPFVPAQYYKDERLPATYANFLIINGAVLVPTYGVEEDKQALSILKKVFKHRKVIGIYCQVLIRQGGSLHCMTMQLPKV